jgi:uncharacterized protein
VKSEVNCSAATILRVSGSVLILLALWAPTLLSAQEQPRRLNDELSFIMSRVAVATEMSPDSSGNRREVSSFGFVGLSLITVYQTLISSQDKSVCNFSPSCSHFGAEAIREAGVMRGTLMAMDRILRCNPYSRSQYKVDSLTGKSYDPVSDYLGESR